MTRAAHAKYRENMREQTDGSDPSMVDWSKLSEGLKESNRQQADDIDRKLKAIGCATRKETDNHRTVVKFKDKEIETMAKLELEHARWNVERFLDGWRLGEEKDIEREISPYLVPWSELPERIKHYDRDAVIAIPELLARVGLEVYRVRS